MIFLNELRTRKAYYHDELHYAGYVAPHIMVLKDGGYLSTIAYVPKDYQSISEEEIEYSLYQIQSGLDRFGEGWTIQFDYHRREIEEQRENVFTHPLLKEFEEENAKKRKQHKHYNSAFYINIFYLLPGKSGDMVNTLLYDEYKEADYIREQQKVYTSRIEEFLYTVSPGFLYADFLRDEELLEYIHACTSLKYHRMKVPSIPFYLDAILDDVNIQTEYPIKIDEEYVAVLHVNDYPTYTRMSMLEGIQTLDFSFRYASRFIAFDKVKGEAELKKYRSRFFSKRKGMMASIQESGGTEVLENTEELAKVGQVDDALERVGNDEFTFGLWTSKVIVYDKNYKELKRKVEVISRVLAMEGFTVKEEKFNAFDGFLGTHPGNVYSDVRRPLMQTRSIVDMIQTHYPWQGERENTHVKEVSGEGMYHVQCTTSGSSTFRLNLNVQDVGHTFIAGPTGSGKSTLLGTLAVQWYRYHKARVIIFDKDRSAFQLALKLGGMTYVPGSEETRLRFQPFRDVDTREGFLFALDFVKTVLGLKNIEVRTEHEKEIGKALKHFCEYEKEERIISRFLELIQIEEIKEVLSQYSEEGAWGFLFDGSASEIGEADMRLFEMADIMKYQEDVVIPTLMYLFYEVEKSMGEVPTLMIIDEAWLFLQHPVFANQIEQWLKVLRKKHVYVVFATQELSDASKSRIADTIQGNCKTKIFLPNPMAKTSPELYKRFGLSDKDIEAIAGGRPKQDYFYASELGKRMFRLDLTEKQLSLLKGHI